MLRDFPEAFPETALARRPGKAASALDRLLEQPLAAPTPLDALRLAKKKFLAGQRLDMGELADQLGINRVTLYRWVGNRERLQVEVLWLLTRKTLDQAGARTRARGGERVARILARFVNAVMANAGMQAWLEREGEAGMRLLTTAGGNFQPRLVAAVRQLLEEEIAAGRLKLPVPAQEFAFVMVRLAESYVYRRFITGDSSDGGSAEALLVHLLR